MIQLDGCNDGLNMVVPHGDDIYHKCRPRLALKAKDLKPIDDHVGLHPSLDGFAKRLDEGRLAIVQSVGHPNPNRSDFESIVIWQTARLHPGEEEPGWLARALDAGRAAPGTDAPASHVAAKSLPQALRGGRALIPSVAAADQLKRRVGISETEGAEGQRVLLDRIAGQIGNSENPLLQFVSHSTVVSYTSSARLEAVLRDQETPEDSDQYGLARRLGLIARMIKAKLATSIYYTQFGGFDTHAEQLNTHSSRLFELSRSVQSFPGKIDKSGDADRVTVLIFSEFGRRLHEKSSAGTDHGTAAPVFLTSRRIRGGLHGPYPHLARLKDDDPEHSIDFRRINASVLERWLRLPAQTSLGVRFEPLPLFRF